MGDPKFYFCSQNESVEHLFFPVSFGKMNLGHPRPLLRGLLTFPKIYNNNALAAWRRALLHIWFGCNLLGNLEVQK